MYLTIQPGRNVMSYTHISIEERACIKKMNSERVTVRKIAEYLDRSPATISREIRRNKGKNGGYHQVTSQRLYRERRKNCGRALKLNQEVENYISERIDNNLSPKQIYQRSKIDKMTLDIPSFATIYRWIHLGLIAKGDMKKLRRKGKFKRPQETRGKFNIGKTLKKRPKSVYKRKEVGHWEADTVESGRVGHQRKSTYRLVTLVERKTRLTLAVVLPNRKEELVSLPQR